MPVIAAEKNFHEWILQMVAPGDDDPDDEPVDEFD